MNTRQKSAPSSAKPGAKPAPKASAKKSASKASSKNAEPGPALPPSNPVGKKRTRGAPAEEADNISPNAASLAEFQAWQKAQAAGKGKSNVAKQKAAKAAKDRGGFPILLLFSSLLTFSIEIQEANTRLLAASRDENPSVEGEASDDEAPPKKKNKTNIILDDDEEEAAKSLSRGAPEEDEDEDEEEEAPGPQLDEGEAEEIFEEEVVNVSPTKKGYSKEPSAESEDDDKEGGDEFDTNGVSDSFTVCMSY